MLLEFEKSEVTKSINFAEKSFSIGNSKVILNILRNKIYTNPMRAMLQEVISNAIDANIENNSDKPVTIHIPFILEPYFFIQDDGIGIDPERMEDVFLKYGESTKRGSNDQIGGFGIGAKSPFAYTDQFVIETITKDGYERHYVAYLDEESDGKMTMTYEEKTNKTTGTKIKVGIREDDIYQIKNYLQEICLFFKTPPVCIGEELEFPVPTDLPFKTDTSWDLYKHAVSYRNESVIAVIRGIPYNATQFVEYRNRIHSGIIVFHCNVGELTIAANREGIEVNEKNKKFINNKMKEITSYSMVLKTWIRSFKNNKSYHLHSKYDTHFITNSFGVSGRKTPWSISSILIRPNDIETDKIEIENYRISSPKELYEIPIMIHDSYGAGSHYARKFFMLNPTVKKLQMIAWNDNSIGTPNFPGKGSKLNQDLVDSDFYKNAINDCRDIVFSHCYEPIKPKQIKKEKITSFKFVNEDDREEIFYPSNTSPQPRFAVITTNGRFFHDSVHSYSMSEIRSILNRHARLYDMPQLKFCQISKSIYNTNKSVKSAFIFIDNKIEDIIEELQVHFDACAEKYYTREDCEDELKTMNSIINILPLEIVDEFTKYELMSREDYNFLKELVVYVKLMTYEKVEEIKISFREKLNNILSKYPLLKYASNMSYSDRQELKVYIKAKMEEGV